MRESPHHRLDPRVFKFLVVAGGATLVGLYQTYQIYWFYPAAVGGGNLPLCFIFNAPMCWLWALTLPILERATRRFPLEARNWFRHLLLHAVIGLGLAVVVQISSAMVIKASHLSRTFNHYSYWWAAVESISGTHNSYTLFWLMFFAVVAAQTYSKLRDREVRAAQLESSLSRAQLAALSSQLNPHFLFNALNSISALLYRDRDSADKMLSRLGELLRVTLAADWTNEIALRDELTLLRRYVEIEELRFAERLSVEMRVEEPMLEARVPPFVLQPLVENAIHHGVSRRREGGRIVVAAHPEENGLLLTVWDDGPGIQGGIARERIGLANTRARLHQLYGPGGALELVQPPRGGLEVRLRIPRRAA